jgi:hypothetical protein
MKKMILKLLARNGLNVIIIVLFLHIVYVVIIYYSIKHCSGKELSPIGSFCIKNIASYNSDMSNSLNIAIEKQKSLDAEMNKIKKFANKKYLLNGKYKGKTFEYLVTNEKKYCEWILQQEWFINKNINKDFIEFCSFHKII